MCVGGPAQVHVEGLTCVSRGSRACSGVRVRAVRRDRHCCARNADHLADNSLLSLVFAEVVCTVGATPTNTTVGVPPNGGGGIARHEAPTRRRHTPGRLRVVQNPHRCRYGGRRRDHGLAAAPGKPAGPQATTSTTQQHAVPYNPRVA